MTSCKKSETVCLPSISSLSEKGTLLQTRVCVVSEKDTVFQKTVHLRSVAGASNFFVACLETLIDSRHSECQYTIP